MSALALLAAALSWADVPAIDAREHAALLARLVPAAREPWETIPWRTDLGGAREEAARSGRPLFLWAMNGNPLGPT